MGGGGCCFATDWWLLGWWLLLFNALVVVKVADVIVGDGGCISPMWLCCFATVWWLCYVRCSACDVAREFVRGC